MFFNTLLLCVIAEKRQMKKFYEKVDDPLNVFCDSFFIVDYSFCFIGSLPPSNSLSDIIVNPRWIVDGGSSFLDVSSACIIDSVLENFKS